jgi:hypothetical protein
MVLLPSQAEYEALLDFITCKPNLNHRRNHLLSIQGFFFNQNNRATHERLSAVLEAGNIKDRDLRVYPLSNGNHAPMASWAITMPEEQFSALGYACKPTIGRIPRGAFSFTLDCFELMTPLENDIGVSLGGVVKEVRLGQSRLLEPNTHVTFHAVDCTNSGQAAIYICEYFKNRPIF